VKTLTGGDPVTARFMRRDFFTYRPSFKLLIAGNHKPRLKNVTEAMRRRLLIVPFVTNPPEPDPQLEAKLRDEWPGVLRWMVEGCVAWREGGLPRPETVQVTTDEYFDEQDTFGQFVEQHLTFVNSNREQTPASDIYGCWRMQAERIGEHPKHEKWMHEQMGQRGFLKKPSNGRTIYTNAKLKEEKPSPEQLALMEQADRCM